MRLLVYIHKAVLSCSTWNPNKLQEYQKLLSPFEVNSLDLSLDEPQIENLKQLCEYKLKDAIKKTQPKVNLFVEDTALYFEEWRFFPGVFIKWMLQSLGPEGIYRSLQAFEKTAYAECCIAFYEPFSQKQYYFQGRISGMIVLPRGEKNFLNMFFDFQRRNDSSVFLLYPTRKKIFQLKNTSWGVHVFTVADSTHSRFMHINI